MNSPSRNATTAPLSPAARRAATIACHVWIAGGLLLLAFVPAARGSSLWFGWLPFWLLCAPLLVLAQLDALGGFARSAAFIARSRRALRRRAWRGGQARRLPRVATAGALSR